MEKKLSVTQHSHWTWLSINMERNLLNITYKDRKTNKWVRDQTKVMDIMEIIKNSKWTWAGHISRKTDNRWTADGVQNWQFGHPCHGCKRIRGRQQKDGEMNYNSTGAMWTGTWEQETETFGGNMLRLASCSGLIMAEEEWFAVTCPYELLH